MTSVDEVTSALQTAGVEKGTHVDRVLSVLDSMGVEHSRLTSPGVIYVRFGRTFKSIMSHGDVHGTFSFDEQALLDSVSIREVITAP